MTPFCLIAALAIAAPVDDGYTPLFNGKDLTGWVNVNCAPGTFFVKGDEIITTGEPTGFLRTNKQYENFVLEVDWMHVNTKEVGNSGVFVWGDPLPAVGTGYTRGIEVQVLVNLEYKDKKSGKVTATSHGDLFSIWGARCTPDRPHPLGWERCLPSESNAKGGGEWNHYKVVANDGTIKLTVNGKEVSGVSKCSPRKGYLALESEAAECHFRNIKIKELPSTNPKPEDVAKVWEGHTSLFTGVDLSGWKTEGNSWKAGGGHLRAAGKADLVSEKSFGPCELIFDWKLPAKSDAECDVTIGPISVTHNQKGSVQLAESSGSQLLGGQGGDWPGAVKPGAWNRTKIAFRSASVVVKVNDKETINTKRLGDKPGGPIRFKPADGLELMNVFVREIKE